MASEDGKKGVEVVESEEKPVVEEVETKTAESELPEDDKKRRSRRSSKRKDSYVPYATLLARHEEAQKLKKVLDAKVTGVVKWFSLRYHYGFIERDDGKGDVFIHQMNIVKSRMNKVYLRSLVTDEKVEFDVVEGKAGPEASNVTGPDGANVRGHFVRARRNGSRTPVARRDDGEKVNKRRKEDTKDGDAVEENVDKSEQPVPRPRRHRRNFNKRNKAAVKVDEDKSDEENVTDKKAAGDAVNDKQPAGDAVNDKQLAGDAVNNNKHKDKKAAKDAIKENKSVEASVIKVAETA